MEQEENNINNCHKEINNNVNKEGKKLNLEYLNDNQEKENLDKNIINNNKTKTSPHLNYDYGDNVDTEIIKEIANTNIKYNIRDNLININSTKEISNLTTGKSYTNLYNEFKRRYNSSENIALEKYKSNNYYHQSYHKNYLNGFHRNYLTLNSNNLSNDFSYNFIEKEIKTPLKYDYENKKNAFTHNRYNKFNNYNKAEDDNYMPRIKVKLLYLENKVKEYEKERNDHINQIKSYKNSFQVISDFFRFISKNYLPNFFPKNQLYQLSNENILYVNFKTLEEYITKLNKELNEYKYKYEKLLDIDSNRPSLSTKNTLNINKPNKEYKTQNTSFSEFYENTSNNSLYDNDIKSLEKRVLFLEKELLPKKKEESDIKIRPKSGNKISFNKKGIKEKKKKKIDGKDNNEGNNNKQKQGCKIFNLKKNAMTMNKGYKNGKNKKK